MYFWKEYVWGKQTLSQLARTFGSDIKTIRRYLDETVPNRGPVPPQPLVLVADVSYFARRDGVLVFRSPRLKRNVFFRFVKGEDPSIYRDARIELERQGFTVEAMVLDGRKGVREVFSDIPVQMCHFHQRQILRRYLTLKPKLEAGRELSALGQILSYTEEQDLERLLDEWHVKWKDFLSEKTFDKDGKHFHYTHKRIRSAYRSLRTNLPYLFTYQRHPKLDIPNTTNTLDGFFSQLKKLLRVHTGLSEERRNKVVEEILNGEDGTKTKKTASRKYH